MAAGACLLMMTMASTWLSRIVWLSTPTPTAGRLRASEFLRTVLQNDATLLPPPPLLQAPRTSTPSTTTSAGTTVRTPIRIGSVCRMERRSGMQPAILQNCRFMRIARVETGDGRVWLARLEDGTAIPVADAPARLGADALRDALADGLDLATAPPAADPVPLTAARLRVPLTGPSKVLAIGRN